MENKCKKAKWLSGEALQIAVKRREAKSKGVKSNKHRRRYPATLESLVLKALKLASDSQTVVGCACECQHVRE